MKDEIISALGLPETLPDFEREQIRRKVLTDNFVYNRVLGQLIAAAAPAAIVALHPLEKSALLTRLGIGPRVQGRAVWGIVYSSQSSNPFVKSECATCKRSAMFGLPEKTDSIMREEQTVQVGNSTFRTPGPSRSVHGISRADAKASIDFLHFWHCGADEKAPPGIVEQWRSILESVVIP